MDVATAPRTQSVPALERALLILEFLARSRHGVTLSQLTRKLQLPKSTSHALLLTFERCGYVQRDEATGRYRMGSRLYALANMALSGTSLRDQAAPFLYTLMQQTGLTVHLAILEQGEAVLIDKVEPPGEPKVATWIGKRMGLHCTALGKALVAALPEAEVEELVRRQGLLRHNENTIASLRKLRQACEQVQQLGYSIDDEEEEIGVCCVGAAILNGERQVVAAISVSGPTTQLASIPAAASLVKQTARAISRHLGLRDEDERAAAEPSVPGDD
jgi:DNA-binding IclR family transcriptional regulator